MNTISSVTKLLISLLNIESISENEKKICDYVFNLLKKIGFKPVKIPVDKNGYNILVKFGRPKFYFSAHLDTVPPFLKIKSTKTHIFGRGASDTKSSAAAMIKAAYDARKKNMTNFGLLFTVGEETNARGSRKIMKHGHKMPFIICGEPTGLGVVSSHYGLFEAKIIAKGADIYGINHSDGLGAIDNLISALSAINKAVKNDKFPKGSLYNISIINGGRAIATVADYAEAYIDITIPPDNKTDFLRKVRRLISPKAKVKLVTYWPPVENKIPKELAFIPKRKIANHASDLSFFQKGVMIGPGNIEISHTKKESVSKNQLRQAVKIYKQIISNYQTVSPRKKQKRASASRK